MNYFVKLYLLLTILSNVYAKDMGEENLREHFLLNQPVSIYKLIVNPEVFENKIVTFSGFWLVTMWESSGMVFPNKDLVKFPNNVSGINIYLKNEYIGKLDHSCDYENFVIQGKLVKKKNNFAVIDAIIRRVPDINENKQGSSCKIGQLK